MLGISLSHAKRLFTPFLTTFGVQTLARGVGGIIQILIHIITSLSIVTSHSTKKDQYADKFNKIKECTENIKESDEDNSLLIQSGFVCLEDAIKDYIERFAYPRRIQRIQRTYKTIPVSVINCINAQETALKR